MYLCKNEFKLKSNVKGKSYKFYLQVNSILQPKAIIFRSSKQDKIILQHLDSLLTLQN